MLAGDGALQCTIDLRGLGAGDTQPWVYYAKANAVRADAIMRGISILEVQVSKSTCTLGTINHFDSHCCANDVTNLISYLNGLPTGDTMYTCISWDEASVNLHPHGGSTALLSTFGVDVTNLVFRGSLAFIAKKGDPSFATSVMKSSGNGPATIVATMSCKLVII